MKTTLLILTSLFFTQASHAQFYQWHLNNDGRVIIETITTSKTNTFEATAGSDLGLGKINLSKDIKIALLDTGVDVSHPELKDAILRNDAECSGTTGLDDDQNGIIDDCLGFDAIKQEGVLNTTSIPLFDNFGHGTHLAGIAAAKIDGQGVEGISNRIKILPVKVVTNQLSSEFTSAIIRGINYAIDRKVDVINLSLGITENYLSTEFITTIQKAISLGIQVVASAGNNKNINTQPPCNISGVICVGGTTPNGSHYQDGSFGGHVDITAQAVSILSTYPTNLKSNFYPEQGFEVLSGTSQATMIVSSLVGMIKNATNGNADEVKARLFLGASAPHVAKSLFGQVNLEKSLSAKASVVIVPDFKQVNSFIVKNNKIKIPLLIKNLWLASGAVQIKVTANNGIVLTNENFTADQMNPSAKRLVSIEAQIPEGSVDNFTLTVEITAQNVKRTFKKNVLLANDYPSLNKRRINVTDNKDDLNFEKLNNGVLMNQVKTLNKNNQSELYYLNKEKNKLFIISNLNSETKTLSFELPVEVAEMKLEKISTPTGTQYILIASYQDSANKAQVGVIYLGEESKVVKFKEHARDVNFANLNLVWDFESNKVVPALVLSRIKSNNSGAIENNLRDLNLSAFRNNELVKFVPNFETSEFEVKSLATEAFYSKIYQALGLSWEDKIEIRFMAKTETSDQDYLLFVKAPSLAFEIKMNNKLEMISLNKLKRSVLNDTTQYVDGSFYQFLNKKAFQRFSTTENKIVELDSASNENILKDAFFHHFNLNGESVDVFMSDSSIHFNGSSVNVNQNIFHQDLLAQTFEALTLTKNDSTLPAILSNQDHTTNGRFQLMFWENGKIKTSAKWSFKRPENCSYVGVVNNQNVSSLAFLCQEQGEVYLDLISVEE